MTAVDAVMAEAPGLGRVNLTGENLSAVSAPTPTAVAHSSEAVAPTPTGPAPDSHRQDGTTEYTLQLSAAVDAPTSGVSAASPRSAPNEPETSGQQVLSHAARACAQPCTPPLFSLKPVTPGTPS